jgi:hypothetical protein
MAAILNSKWPPKYKNPPIWAMKDHNMVPNSKNDDDYQFARTMATWKANFAQIGGFLYFGGHFEYHLASVVVVRRLSSVVRRKLFQKSSPLKVLDQWKPNLKRGQIGEPKPNVSIS